jgi:hypothetical protein
MRTEKRLQHGTQFKVESPHKENTDLPSQIGKWGDRCVSGEREREREAFIPVVHCCFQKDCGTVLILMSFFKVIKPPCYLVSELRKCRPCSGPQQVENEKL